MSKIDFEQIVPPPPVRPQTPRCEHKNCLSKSTHRVDGKHYCRVHAGAAALRYLDKLATLQGD